MMQMDAEFSGRLLDATFNTIRTVICTSIRGERLYSCNDYFLEVFGYTSLETFKQQHQCICELFIEDKEKGYIGQEVDGIRWSEYVFLHQKEKTVKTKILSGGSERIYSINVEKLSVDDEERYLVILDDITIQEAYESSLKEEIEKQTREIRHLYKIMAESEKIAKTGVIEIRLDRDEDTWSDGIYQIFEDYDHKTAPSFENGLKFIHPEDRARVTHLRSESIKTQKCNATEHRIITANGREKYVRVNGHFLASKDGMEKRFVIVLRDITMERRVEELQEENRKLALRQHHLNSLREMFKNIAHHWRQPLSVISMTTASFLDENLTQNQRKESVHQIQQEIHFLSRTIGHFTNAVLEKKAERDVDIGEEVQEAIHLLKPRLEETKIVVTTNFIDEVSLFTIPYEITKIVYEMIENAIDSISEKRERDREFEGRIDITLEKVGSLTRLSISDNGVGMDDDVAQKVFEPYFTTKFKSRGVGMSLSLNQYIVEHLFGGHITVNNDLAEGVEFRIEFPLG